MTAPPTAPAAGPRRAAAWSLRVLVGAVFLGALAFFFLTRTDRGADLVIEEILGRLPINGTVSVGAVRADRLLREVRLYDVDVRGSDGRSVVTVDSVRLQYRWRVFVSNEWVVDGLDLWRPELSVERLPGDTAFNVQRLLASAPEADSATAPTGPGRSFRMRSVAVHDGRVRVLYPADSASGGRWVTVPVPEGEGRLVSHAFTEVEARLPDVVLSGPGSTGPEVEIDSLAFLAAVSEEPMRVRQLQGRFLQRDARVDLEMDRLELAGSVIEGTAFLETRPDATPHYGFEARVDRLDLADLRWVDPRVPAGRAEGGLTLDATGPEFRLFFDDFALATQDGEVELDGRLALTDGQVAFDALRVRAADLALDRLGPWLEQPLPVGGVLDGTAELSGTSDALTARGRATLRRGVSGEGPITADFRGVLHLDETDPGVTDFTATLDPFEFGVLGAFAEGLRVTGPGRASIDASGRASSGVRFTLDLHHRPVGLPPSDLLAQGSITRSGDGWSVDVQADAAPLSLTALARGYPGMPLAGDVTGAIRARGPLTDLAVTTDLRTDAGRLALSARFDATRPGAHYAIEGEVAGFALSRLLPSLPSATVMSGRVDIEGRGTDPATLSLDARAWLRPSRVGGLFVDTLALAVTARAGVLHLDTVTGSLGGVQVRAGGSLALDTAGPAGTVTVAFQSDSLGRLRPLVLGDVVIARDTLTALDRELLSAQGIDPDTLPTQAEVTASGTVRGELTLRGSVRDFAAEGTARFTRLRAGPHVARGATVSFGGTGLPTPRARWTAHAEADSLTLWGRAFAAAGGDGEYTHPRGRATSTLSRGPTEDYRARAAFEATEAGGTVELEELALRFGDGAWTLRGPTTVGWDDDGVRVGAFDMASADGAVRIEASGLVPREGGADLDLRVTGLPLARVAALLQREDLGVEGRLALEARVTGTRAAPRIVGRFDATDLAFAPFALTRLAGQMDYAARTMYLAVGAWRGDHRILTASGQVPVDLALEEVPRRVPTDRQMNLAVVADSLPAALVLAYVTALEDVVGTLSGVFQVGGTVNDPSPEGTVTLNDAGWTLAALGVRHDDITGTLRLRRDGTVEVNANGRAGGTIATTGRILLQPLTDPTFDLEITAVGFQAVRRLDVEGTLSGSVTLTGTYSRPVVRSREGQPLRVDEGVLYVEEAQRTAGVVDLADPAFFAVVDTSIVNPRPLLGATANPFLRNLRVDVSLTAERNSWLRSKEMNVEMSGQLQVLYDRQSRDLVMLGDLQAIRGTYSVLGRSFQVESGAVQFVGTPGINPILGILASTRVRPAGNADGDPITIQAVVAGTLQVPRVSLTSDDGAIAESDLVSYLVFGVPSYQLASGQAQLLRGAAGSILGTTFGAGLSILQGTLASHLSSLVAREWGLDYFAISQPDQLGLSQLDLSTTLGSTTFEVGWYLAEDVFLTLLLRPLGRVTGTAGVDPFGGARMDWVLTDTWTLQAFFEDRWLRQPTLGFDQQILNQRKVAGLFLFRDWGYGGRGSEPGTGGVPQALRLDDAAPVPGRPRGGASVGPRAPAPAAP